MWAHRRAQGKGRFWQAAGLAVQAVLTLVAFAVVLARSRDRGSVRCLVGVSVFVPSFSLWLWARCTLAIRGCFAVGAQVPPELVTSGLYARFRHPVYIFSSLFAAGLTLVSGNYYALAAVILVAVPVQLFRARAEDRVLALRFKGHWTQWARSEDVWL